MCRFVAYMGNKAIALEDLVSKPEHSLVNQSKDAKDTVYRINGDGFGVSWYHGSNSPGVYKTVQPAWNDANLKYIARDIHSKCFLAHVRASTVGDVSHDNCHPFVFESFSFVHNGTIKGMRQLKRSILEKLDDDLFSQIKGQTDSECLFYLIIQYYRESDCLTVAVKAAFSWLTNAEKKLPLDVYSTINIVITDGKEFVTARYSTKENDCVSLFYADSNQGLIVASEKLTDCVNKWRIVPKNSIVTKIKGDINISVIR